MASLSSLIYLLCVAKHELMDLVDKYKSRTYDEEIVALNEHDGKSFISEASLFKQVLISM